MLSYWCTWLCSNGPHFTVIYRRLFDWKIISLKFMSKINRITKPAPIPLITSRNSFCFGNVWRKTWNIQKNEWPSFSIFLAKTKPFFFLWKMNKFSLMFFGSHSFFLCSSFFGSNNERFFYKKISVAKWRTEANLQLKQ